MDAENPVVEKREIIYNRPIDFNCSRPVPKKKK